MDFAEEPLSSCACLGERFTIRVCAPCMMCLQLCTQISTHYASAITMSPYHILNDIDNVCTFYKYHYHFSHTTGTTYIHLVKRHYLFISVEVVINNHKLHK